MERQETKRGSMACVYIGFHAQGCSGKENIRLRLGLCRQSGSKPALAADPVGVNPRSVTYSSQRVKTSCSRQRNADKFFFILLFFRVCE